jgi:excinuclease UvrABC nuclease subunit
MSSTFKNWRSTSFSAGARTSVPDQSGVYAILRVERVLGLPRTSEVLYIGKSLSLRIRLGQHLNPHTAHNEVSFANDRTTLEFWCHPVPSAQLNSAEQDLIRSIKPKTNKILYFSKQ